MLREIARVLHPGGVFVHGADDRSSDWAQWRESFGRHHHIGNVGVSYDEMESFPEQEGWRIVGAPQHITFSEQLEPGRLVERVVRRDWSWTWPLSDAQIADAAASLRATLTQRFGDLDTRAEVQSGFWVRAYQPPTA